MSEGERIKSLVREAGIYRSQGLLSEAKQRYGQALQIIEKHEKFSKDERLIRAVGERIREVEATLKEIDEAPETPELSSNVQDLISNLFAFSRNRDVAEIEGAVALAKFGQYEKALQEFQRLIEKGTLPLMAGMNLLRCHLALSSPEEAMAQFKKWASRDVFPKGDLRYLRGFLESALTKMGIQPDLPPVEGDPVGEEPAGEEASDFLEMTSLGIRLEAGPRKGEEVDFEVTFQTGNKVSIVIPAGEGDLVQAFKPGSRLEKVQCYSPIAVFGASGLVSGLSRITSGPKRGSYTLDVTIQGG